MWLSIRYYVIAAAVAVLAAAGAYWKGHADGDNACAARYAEAQLNQNLKEAKTDAKRDRAKPVNTDRATKLKWLRDNARSQ